MGHQEAGKTIFAVVLGLLIKSKKTLIIDLDENKNITKILNVQNRTNDLKEVKFNKKIYVLNLNKKICNKEEAEEIVKKIKNKYEKIIIDSSNDFLNDFVKNIDINIFLTEPNLIEINKTREMLEKYIYQLNIEKNKIKIIFNKYNKYSINYNILKNIFAEFNILGKINLNNKYNYFINKNIKIIDKKIKEEYIKIIKNI